MTKRRSKTGKRKTGNEKRRGDINGSRGSLCSSRCVFRLPFPVFRLSFLFRGRTSHLDVGQAQLVEDPGEQVGFFEGNVSSRLLFERAQPVDHLPRGGRVCP